MAFADDGAVPDVIIGIDAAGVPDLLVLVVGNKHPLAWMAKLRKQWAFLSPSP